jgi:hypothetical protein
VDEKGRRDRRQPVGQDEGLRQRTMDDGQVEAAVLVFV